MTKDASDLDATLATGRLSPAVRVNLARVYATLALCILSAAAGCAAVLVFAPWLTSWVFTTCIVGGVLTAAGGCWLSATPKQLVGRRFAILVATSACTGLLLSVCVAPVLQTDPSIVLMAFLMTMVVMVCFSGAVLVAQQQGMALYLVSLAITVLVLAVVNLALLLLRIFVYLSTLEIVSLYVGLAMYCLCVSLQTETIIAKASLGEMNALDDALSILMQLIQVFIQILSILSRSKSDGESKPLLGESAA